MRFIGNTTAYVIYLNNCTIVRLPGNGDCGWINITFGSVIISQNVNRHFHIFHGRGCIVQGNRWIAGSRPRPAGKSGQQPPQRFCFLQSAFYGGVMPYILVKTGMLDGHFYFIYSIGRVLPALRRRINPPAIQISEIIQNFFVILTISSDHGIIIKTQQANFP